jgi:hypothetical protein
VAVQIKAYLPKSGFDDGPCDSFAGQGTWQPLTSGVRELVGAHVTSTHLHQAHASRFVCVSCRMLLSETSHLCDVF